MTEGIMIALITGGLAVLSNIVVAAFQNSKTLYRIDQLEKKVEKHNNFIERMYELERVVDVHEEKLKVADHRIEDLEEYEKRS